MYYCINVAGERKSRRQDKMDENIGINERMKNVRKRDADEGVDEVPVKVGLIFIFFQFCNLF